MAIKQALDAAGATTRGGLVVQTRAGDRVVKAGQIVELGRAARNNLINLSTSPDAYPV